MAGRDKKSVIKKEIDKSHDEPASVDSLKKDIANKKKNSKVIKKHILSSKKKNNTNHKIHLKKNSEVNSDNCNSVGQLKGNIKANSIRKGRQIKSDPSTPFSRNGTRSSSRTLRLLRNGKKRQLDETTDFNDFENIQKRRRRLLSTKTEKPNNEMLSDDQSIITESDGCSLMDAPLISNGKNSVESELESKMDLNKKEIISDSEPSHIKEIDLNLKIDDIENVIKTKDNLCLEDLENTETKKEIILITKNDIELKNEDDEKIIKEVVHDSNELSKDKEEPENDEFKDSKDFLDINNLGNDLSDVEQYDISQEFSIKIDSVLCDSVLRGESFSISQNDFSENNNLISENSGEMIHLISENSGEMTQVRRSTRSSIDKTRAALTRCFTTSRSTGKVKKDKQIDTQVKDELSNATTPIIKTPSTTPTLASEEETSPKANSNEDLIQDLSSEISDPNPELIDLEPNDSDLNLEPNDSDSNSELNKLDSNSVLKNLDPNPELNNLDSNSELKNLIPNPEPNNSDSNPEPNNSDPNYELNNSDPNNSDSNTELNISDLNQKLNDSPTTQELNSLSSTPKEILEKDPPINSDIENSSKTPDISSSPLDSKINSASRENQSPQIPKLPDDTLIVSVIEPPPTIQDSPTTLNLPRPTPLSPQTTSTHKTLTLHVDKEQISKKTLGESEKEQNTEDSTKNVLTSIDVATFYNTENITRVNGEINGIMDNNDSELKNDKSESKLSEEEIVENSPSNNNMDFMDEGVPETEKDTSEEKSTNIPDTPEDIEGKEIILKALGLQSLKAAEETRAALLSNRNKLDVNYTGTLKTIIKLHKSPERKKKPLKLVLKQNRSEYLNDDNGIKYSISKEAGQLGGEVYLNNNSEDINNGETSAENDDSKSKQSSLIIPEKSSSFSIHPGRLCSDVCSYCFGKFGSLDTPCHIAQLKTVDRQEKILKVETHLTADSCLCDACIRHVDRKANCPSYKENKKRHQMKTNDCSALGCHKSAQHFVRRKWLIKLKKSIAKKVPLDSEKLPQNLPIPLCEEHYNWVDYYMVCGICKRRLSRNHMNPLGSDLQDVNKTLALDGIPVRLTDKMFLCKLCRYYSTLRIKHSQNNKLTGSNQMFINAYRKRILCFHDIEIEGPAPAAGSEPGTKSKRKRNRKGNEQQSKDPQTSNSQKATLPTDLLLSFPDQSPSQQDILTLQKDIHSESSSPIIDIESLSEIPVLKKPTSGKSKTSTSNCTTTSSSIVSHPIFRTVGNGNGGTVILLDQNPLRQQVGDAVNKPCFPGIEQLPLEANLEFTNSNLEKKYVNHNWEKCTATIQMEKNTKVLYQKLQLPYGNSSSFFRHMVLLEKFWRSGDLSLTPSASPEAINYFRSVQTRVRSFEGYPAVSVPVQTQIFPAAMPSPKPPVEMSFRRSAPSSTYTPSATVTSNSCNTQIIHQKRKPIPNLLQMNPDGLSFTIMPCSINRPFSTTSTSSSTSTTTSNITTTLTPTSKSNMVICDVRSLAPQETIERWDQKKLSSIEALTNNPSLSVSIVPAATATATATTQSNTVVTPTGIILSRNPEMCISSVTVKKK